MLLLATQPQPQMRAHRHPNRFAIDVDPPEPLRPVRHRARADRPGLAAKGLVTAQRTWGAWRALGAVAVARRVHGVLGGGDDLVQGIGRSGHLLAETFEVPVRGGQLGLRARQAVAHFLGLELTAELKHGTIDAIMRTDDAQLGLEVLLGLRPLS